MGIFFESIKVAILSVLAFIAVGITGFLMFLFLPTKSTLEYIAVSWWVIAFAAGLYLLWQRLYFIKQNKYVRNQPLRDRLAKWSSLAY